MPTSIGADLPLLSMLFFLVTHLVWKSDETVLAVVRIDSVPFRTLAPFAKFIESSSLPICPG